MTLKSLAALTLLEIVVALVILSLTMLGMVNVFVSGKRHVHHVRSRVSGIQLGKAFLDPLQESVRADTWDSPANILSINDTTGASQIVGNLTFTPAYNVTAAPMIPANYPPLRKVRMTVTWVERKLTP